jgi:hypothetical protein
MFAATCSVGTEMAGDDAIAVRALTIPFISQKTAISIGNGRKTKYAASTAGRLFLATRWQAPPKISKPVMRTMIDESVPRTPTTHSPKEVPGGIACAKTAVELMQFCMAVLPVKRGEGLMA